MSTYYINKQQRLIRNSWWISIKLDQQLLISNSWSATLDEQISSNLNTLDESLQQSPFQLNIIIIKGLIISNKSQLLLWALFEIV